MNTRGFTVIELILIIALVAIIASFGTVMTLSSLTRSSVSQERDLFVTLLLRGSRAAALANVNESAQGIYIDNDAHSYIQFEGEFFSPSNPTNRTVPFSSHRVTLTNTGGDTIIFEPLSGNVLQGDGIITIESGASAQQLSISPIGQIDW